MFAAALAVRVAAMGYLYHRSLDWVSFDFGSEMGWIARSIASGQGFSSPFRDPTGPTAWTPPLYPYLLAGVFKLFGTHTFASALVILVLDNLFSAALCITIYLIGSRSFGTTVGALAGWGWAFFPYAIYNPVAWVWEAPLSTLLLSIVFLMALDLARADAIRPRTAAIFGLLCGILTLSNATVLSTLPLLVAWVCYRLNQRRVKWAAPAGIALLVSAAVVTPWIVRNYLVFDRFIFFRGNFGLELFLGNNRYAQDLWGERSLYSLHPARNEKERARYREVGELAYMAEKRREAVQSIAADPWTFVRLTSKRFLFMWTGIWMPMPTGGSFFRFAWANALVYTVLSALVLMGLTRSIRHGVREIVPYVILLVVFPIPYYVTHASLRYRHLIDPEIMIVAAYGVTALVARGRHAPGWTRPGVPAAASSGLGPTRATREAGT